VDALGFGRWMLGTNLLQPFTIQFFPWILAGFYGTAATAEFQALSTLLGVSNPVMATSSNLVVPIAARAATEGEQRVRGLVVRIGLQSFALLAPFYAVMLLAPSSLLRLVFGSQSPYVSLGGEMRLLTIAYMALLCLNILGNYFVGIGRSKDTFVAQIAGVGVAVTVGMALVWRFGVAGACLASTASTLIQVAWLYRLWGAPAALPPAALPPVPAATPGEVPVEQPSARDDQGGDR
jgi:O-antigen/teichoic acid export membrane protein